MRRVSRRGAREDVRDGHPILVIGIRYDESVQGADRRHPAREQARAGVSTSGKRRDPQGAQRARNRVCSRRPKGVSRPGSARGCGRRRSTSARSGSDVARSARAARSRFRRRQRRRRRSASIHVKGPKGSLSERIPAGIGVEIGDGPGARSNDPATASRAALFTAWRARW